VPRGKDRFVLVRPFKNGDEPALQAVFYSAIHTIAAQDYTVEQLDAWAPHRPDWEAWTARMQALQPFVAEADGRVVGYADLQASGYIDHFFVSGKHARRGVGRLLMDRLHARAAELGLARLFSEVSLTAEPFFEHFGFRVVERKTAVMGRISLPNARMEKVL
jgi:putative acetyltransferase